MSIKWVFNHSMSIYLQSCFTPSGPIIYFYNGRLWQNINRVSSFDSCHLMELFLKEIIVLLLTKQRKLTSFKEFFIIRHFFLNNQLIKLKNLSWQRSVFNKVRKQLGPYSIVFREGHHPFIVMDGVEGKKNISEQTVALVN